MSLDTPTLIEFVRLIIDDDIDKVSERLFAEPLLATASLPVGATRGRAADFFFEEIGHYMYEGDTALHMAAAGCSPDITSLLLANDADPRAKNRRGAEPLHYASDGGREKPPAQTEVIKYLIARGADPNAVDKSGVTPLHRAVRRRSASAVTALIDGGANVRQRNGSGSTPLHLAVQNTGASGSGSDEAHEQQAEIIKLLLAHGAVLTDKDAKGKTAGQAATSEWVRDLLSYTAIG